LCERKWGWSHLDGIYGEPNAAAQRGTDVHAVLEAWLTKGTPPDRDTVAGKIALVGIKHLPPPGAGQVEQHFELYTEKHTYHGYVDLEYFKADGTLVVRDHKTTSSLQWALTEEDLRTDEQGLIYGAQACIKHNKKEVELEWGYLTTSGHPKSHPVRLLLTLDEIENAFKTIEETADKIVAAKHSGKRALDMLPNAVACDAFGGCPHISRCNLTAKERMKSIMAQDGQKETMKEKLERRAREKAGAAPPQLALVPTPTNGAAVNPPEQPKEPATTVPQAAEADAPRRGRPKGSTNRAPSGAVSSDGVTRKSVFVTLVSAALIGHREKPIEYAIEILNVYDDIEG
jgi:hypothetical protein